ncbi:MAG: hypothetical protein IJ037_00880 [Clostridia bacterium]|nr:hypothetical protein [Clostridia bacterium]MBQ8370071.1 hypothetical protein [Clostridia bacterium]MBQ8511337.1 hypothetical protein [Clostridia bacterium]
MAFFEELKRNASGVANKAAKKTNDLTSLAKLNVAIKNTESKLASVYEEIGRLFYNAERNGEDYTSDIAALIMKADKMKADIEATQKQINALRKVVVCEGCGNEISEEAAYCSFCGTKQVKPEPVVEETVEEAVEEIVEEAAEAVEEVVEAVEETVEEVKDAE